MILPFTLFSFVHVFEYLHLNTSLSMVLIRSEVFFLTLLTIDYFFLFSAHTVAPPMVKNTPKIRIPNPFHNKIT